MQEEEVKSDVVKILDNQLSDVNSNQIITEPDSKVIVNVVNNDKEEQQTKTEDSKEIILHEEINSADDINESNPISMKHVSFEDDTQVKNDADVKKGQIAEEDSDETLSTTVDRHLNFDHSNQMENEGDLKVIGDEDDNNEKDEVVLNQIPCDVKDIDEEKSRIRSE